MKLGVDYSERSSNWPAFARALVANRRTFVGRYLATDLAYMPKDRRVLTKPEAEALAAAGVDVFVWWENSPNHVGSHTEQRVLDGYNAGADDARSAAAMMEYFGQPHRPVFFCVDYDLTPDACRAYFNGVLSVLPVERVGVYGGYYVVKGLFNMGLVKYAAQTEAWSYTQGTRNPPTWEPRAQLHQWCVPGHGTYGGNIGGIECDGLEAHAEDFGQWRYGVTVAPETGDDEMTAQEHEALCRTTVRVLGTHFDVAYLRAKADGGTPEELAAILAKRTLDIAHEKAWLDPDGRIWPK